MIRDSNHRSQQTLKIFVDYLRRFCTSETSTQVFEQWLYSTPEIEDLVGPDMYLELISVDFSSDPDVRKTQKSLNKWLQTYFPPEDSTNTAVTDAHAFRLDTMRDLRRQLEAEIQAGKKALNDLQAKCEQLLRDKDLAIRKIIEEQSFGFPWLARSIAEYQTLSDFQHAEILQRRKRPAIKTAEALRDIAAEKRELLKQVRVLRSRIEFYEKLFPWLTDYVDVDIDTLLGFISMVDEEQEEDPVRLYLSPGEFKRLSPKVRNQMALDRYWASRKEPWQLGRDYERYVGYLYEEQDYQVQYFGIEAGLGDLGRDLICRKGDEFLVIQCKYWAPFRRIHEKHIAQLLGTFLMYKLENNISEKAHGKAIFVTSTSLTDKAMEFADYLEVQVRQNLAFEQYPCVKCNTFSRTGDKIYHLPMDQQYDRIVMSKNVGRFYVDSVEEAETRGFRRAWRWKPPQERAQP